MTIKHSQGSYENTKVKYLAKEHLISKLGLFAFLRLEDNLI